MTTLTRLSHARTALVLGVVAAALGWGLAAEAGLTLALGLVDVAVGIPLSFRRALVVLVPLAGLAVAGRVIWRNRGVGSRESIALWLEDQSPAMHYALVTLVEGRFVAAGPALEAQVAEVSWAHPIGRALLRGAGLPVLVALLTLGALSFLPPAILARVRSPSAGDVLFRSPTTVSSDPFRPLIVTVTPPAYSGLHRVVLENPEAISGLIGSSVQIEGRGLGESTSVSLGGRKIGVSEADDHWTTSMQMPDSASALWLEQGTHRRLLVLEPRPDSVPRVRLLSPSRDTVRSDPGGTVPLKGEAEDDFGISAVWLEYIISSGEGENFTFRSGTIGRQSLSNARTGEVSGDLRLDSLELRPGNIVHLRAVARDGNTATGPGIGYSDTRTIRIPGPGEGDSISVDQAAPAAGDSSLLSQRMLIILTEALERRRPRLRRDSVIAEARRIARDQAALRRRVADIIFLRLGSEASMEEAGDTAEANALTPEALLLAAEQATVANGGEALDFSEDETPVVALNRPLLEAYNAMWEAGRELDIGAPGPALPHMRVALAAVQRARQAERIYLRGRPGVQVVDLAKVRLAGEIADAAPGPATPAQKDEKSREALLSRFTRAVELLSDPSGVDSLQLLRIDALTAAPDFSVALSEAIAALRSGADATAALVKARRLLAGPVRPVPGLNPWDVAP